MRKPVYYSFRDILKKHGAGNFNIDSIGRFTTSYDGDAWNFREMRSWCNTPSGIVMLKNDRKRFTLTVGKMVFRLDCLREKPDGDTIVSPDFPLEGSILYRFKARGSTYSFFYANYPLCSGSFCMMSTCFLINHRLQSINVFRTYPTFYAETPLIGDVNGDSIPEFLYPHFICRKGSQLPYSDTTEIMHIIPYAQDSVGNYSPVKQGNGKELHFRYYVDFQRHSEKIIREAIPTTATGH